MSNIPIREHFYISLHRWFNFNYVVKNENFENFYFCRCWSFDCWLILLQLNHLYGGPSMVTVNWWGLWHEMVIYPPSPIHWDIRDVISGITSLSPLYSDHSNDVIMGSISSQITSLTIVYSKIYSGADQRKHQSSAALAFVQGIHQGPVNSLHKWPAMQKMFPFDDVIML